MSCAAQHDPERNAVRLLAKGGGSGERRPNWARQITPPDLVPAPSAHSSTCCWRSREGQTDLATTHAGKALEAGLPFDRLRVGPREWLGRLRETETFAQWSKERGGGSRLIHGPMVGAVTDRTARVWVRTDRAATVTVAIEGAEATTAQSTADSDYTAVVQLRGLEPGREYAYDVRVDGEKCASARLRTFPAQGKPARFTVAFGGGAGFVPERERMWDVICAKQPLAMLMLGDNVYIDDPKHSATQRYCYYRRQSRPEWRRLTASTAMFAIYDDHDFGTNDCVPGAAIDQPAWKRPVWELFRKNWVNPSYGGGDAQPGCWFDVVIGDAQFFFLDGRYYRDDEAGSMLGDSQKAWLLRSLCASTATFKVLATPVPITAGIKPGSKDPWDGYPSEREEILQFIDAQPVDGVFWIAGDRHRTDVRVTPRESGYDVIEWTSSKLTNRHTHPVVRGAGLVDGYNEQCSFALMHFDTVSDEPSVRLECVALDGATVFEYELPLARLRSQ